MSSETSNTFIYSESQIKPGILTNASVGTTAAVALSKLAATTQGQVLYDNGTNIVSLPVGTNGQFLQTQGAGANPQWATAADWVQLTTLSPVAVTNISSGALTAYDEYRIEYRISSNQAGPVQLGLQLNADAGNNYYYYDVTNAPALASVAGVASIPLADMGTTYNAVGEARIEGLSPNIAASTIQVGIRPTGWGNKLYLAGEWASGQAIQVTSMKFLASAGTLSGKIIIYGRNDV